MNTKYSFCILAVLSVLAASCEKPGPEPVPLPRPPAGWDEAERHTLYPQIEASVEMPVDERGGRILDFSRVGYRWGDEEIPDVPVVKTIEAPSGGADATSLINAAIAEVAALPLNGRHRGAILFREGTYNVSSQITLAASGIVLRGEGPQKTKIVGVGARSVNIDAFTPNIFIVGTSGSRNGTKPSRPNVTDSYVPEGSFCLRVSNPSDFAVMDNVVIYREVNDQWLKDLGMSSIWKLSNVNQQYAERVVTRISKDTLWFENPIPCAIQDEYGGGYVYKYSYANRTSECGIENMALESEFFSAENESHCWNGVSFMTCEHCWMRNVNARYFGAGLAYIRPNAKNITVENCNCTDFQGTVQGSRRYPYLICGQLSLVRNCNSADSRHPYATSGSNSVGPNVFSGGTGLRSTADTGPHRCWAAGTLYENLDVEGQFNIRNRYTNSSHGWAGVNDVAWNCSSSSFPAMSWSYGFIIQSPQVSGHNYAIGCVGTVKTNTFDTGCNPPSGQGVFLSHGTNVTPRSLYEAQKQLRRTTQPGGVFDVK